MLPILTCGCCKYWDRIREDRDVTDAGRCLRMFDFEAMEGSKAKACGTVFTMPDFGCTEFKDKESRE